MHFAIIATVVACAAVSAAGQPPVEAKDGKVTVHMTLTPGPEQKPTSRFLLQPQFTDQMHGEKLAGFLKCFMEQDRFFNVDNQKKREAWNELPIDQLPLDEIRAHGVLDGMAYNPPYARLMVFIDQAARYDRLDWNIRDNLKRDGISTLIPEVQKLRSLSAVLRLRMRSEVKAREFAKAIETAKTLFGLVRMLEQHPTLIGHLVGVAIASQAIEALEEMVQQPGCPNLYWGLTDLGSPVVDIRPGAQGERTFLFDQVRQILEARGPLADEELMTAFRKFDGLYSLPEGQPKREVPPPPSTQFKKLAADAAWVESARKYLIDTGSPPELVKSFTPLQAVFVADFRHYEQFRDDALKLLPLPLWEAAPLGAKLDEDLKQRKGEGKYVLGPEMVPAVMRVRQANARIDQRVAYLRVVEAIRLHAHEHGGKPPASLDEVKMPLPLDPVTGKPFTYSIKDGDVAVLHGGNPRLAEPKWNREYEIHLRK
jgi:hypothetical protein